MKTNRGVAELTTVNVKGAASLPTIRVIGANEVRSQGVRAGSHVDTERAIERRWFHDVRASVDLIVEVVDAGPCHVSRDGV